MFGCSEQELLRLLRRGSGRSGQQGELQQRQPAQRQHLRTDVQQQRRALQEAHAAAGQRSVRSQCNRAGDRVFRSRGKRIETS